MSARSGALLAVAATLIIVPPAFSQAPAQDPPKPRKIEIQITTDGFTPPSVEVERKAPIELVFVRRTDKTCATEVVVPSLKLKKPLPLNEPVVVPLTPEKDDVTFACGMNMLKGKLVVK
jgi:plastocyanin domain-containing protein